MSPVLDILHAYSDRPFRLSRLYRLPTVRQKTRRCKYEFGCHSLEFGLSLCLLAIRTSSPHIVKPDEKGSPSPKEKSSPESTPETKPAIPKKILFGSGSAAKHRPIPVDTECFDYEDFTHNYGKNNRRREKPSNKIDSKIPGKSTGSNANETKSIKILKVRAILIAFTRAIRNIDLILRYI